MYGDPAELAVDKMNAIQQLQAARLNILLKSRGGII